MARLTTHVLDIALGRPAAGIKVELYAAEGERRFLARAVMNSDGRCDAPFGEGGDIPPGLYELVYHAGDYFRGIGVSLPDPPFIDRVVVRFGIAEGQGRYHLPLLLSPWSYSVYRGS
jgi:5-hydroxyisourate hydrolase